MFLPLRPQFKPELRLQQKQRLDVQPHDRYKVISSLG